MGWGTQWSEAGVGRRGGREFLLFTSPLIFFAYSLGMLTSSTWHLVEPIAFENYIPVSLSQVREQCRSLWYPVKIPLSITRPSKGTIGRKLYGGKLLSRQNTHTHQHKRAHYSNLNNRRNVSAAAISTIFCRVASNFFKTDVHFKMCANCHIKRSKTTHPI